MHKFIAIFHIAGGRGIGSYGSIRTVKQYLTVHALSYPAVLQLLALVL